MPTDDKAYFQARAEEEIALAQNATHPDAVRSHYLLAGFYLDLVHNGTADNKVATTCGSALEGNA